MNLVNLPDEILMIIFEMLDMRSLYNLHTVSDRIKNIIRTYGSIKTCNLSLSLMARADTLKLPFFQDIARNLKELNVCGVCDLSKTGLSVALKRLKCLNKLDVTYTNITILDVVDIINVCPTITDIGVNFTFNTSHNTLEGTLNPIQEVFKNFSNVHFVGNLHIMMYSRLPCFVLKYAKLKKLQYTIIDKMQANYYSVQCKDILNFESFSIHFSPTVICAVAVPVICTRNDLNHNIDHYGCLKHMGLFDVLDLSSYELIIILLSSKNSPNKPLCCATRMFETFFNKYSSLQEHIELQIVSNFQITMAGNVDLMLWNKSSTTFDDKFFSNLWEKFQHLLPCYFDSSSNTPVAPDYDLYVTIPQGVEQTPRVEHVGLKRKRIGSPSCVLNYDSVFQEKSKVKLLLSFQGNLATRVVTLPKRCDYLNKLTYLNLKGPVNFSSDFFNVLFRCCNNLATLKINAYSANTFCGTLARSLPLSQSIKNIHIMDRHIDFPLLYVSMSQCKTLENVHILDRVTSTDFTDASVVFEKCVNLYCFYLYIRSSFNDRKKFMQIFKKSDLKQTNVKLLLNEHLICDPYSDVFRVNLYFK